MYDTTHYLAMGLLGSLIGFGSLPALPLMVRRWRGQAWMPGVVGAFFVLALLNCGQALHFFWKALAG